MNLRLLYLYLFSFVGLLIVVIGSIQLVNLGLKLTIFKDVDYYEIYSAPKMAGEVQEPIEIQQARQRKDVERQRQREFITAFSMLVVGAPLYLYHWNTIKRENKKA
jgi:hypothetical protein